MRKILFFILIVPVLGFAQNQDAVLWTGAGIGVDVTKKLSVDAETQVRFDENMSNMLQTYGELGASYRVIKGLRLGLIYRYSRKNEGSYYFNENRFCIDAKYQYKLDFGLSLKTRLRYQHSFDRFSEINGVYPRRKNTFRWKVGLAYKHADFKRVQPFLAAEFYNALQPQNSTSSLDTYRIKFGALLDLPKRHSVKIFYMYEHENRSVDNNYHIYGIQYNYTLKPLHKKKKADKAAPSE